MLTQIIISFLYNFRPVQDYFSSYETDKSVTRWGGGRTLRKRLGTPTSRIWFVSPVIKTDQLGSNLRRSVHCLGDGCCQSDIAFFKKKKKKKISSRISYQTTLPAPIAQVVERPLRDREVAGSILGRAIPNGVKNGTGSSLADARNKRVVPGRYKKAGKYLLRIFVMSHNS